MTTSETETGNGVTNDGWTTVEKPFDRENTVEWNPETVGDVLIGTYTYTTVIKMTDKQNAARKYDANVYEITKDNGVVFTLWGSFAIDNAFKSIPLNSLVRVEYKGQREIDNDRRVKEFLVQYKK